MADSLLFSSLLLLVISNTPAAYGSNDLQDRFANDGSHVRTHREGGKIMRPKPLLSLFSYLALFQDLKCYVPGQCQEFLVDFQASQDPDECGKFCHDHNANLQDGDVHRCI